MQIARQMFLPLRQVLASLLSGLGISSVVSTKVVCRLRHYLPYQALASCPWISWLPSPALCNKNVHLGFVCGSAWQILLPLHQVLACPLSGLGLSSVVSAKVVLRLRQYLTCQALDSHLWIGWFLTPALCPHTAQSGFRREISLQIILPLCPVVAATSGSALADLEVWLQSY